jgi:UDPglucose 6-dehydrogenase
VLGLSFKAGTSDARRSPPIAIANTLAEQGAHVRVYDPQAMEEAKEDLDERVELCDDTASSVRDAVCIFICTDWPEFKDFDYSKAPNAKLLVDAMNCIEKEHLPSTMAYLGVGKNY